MQVTSVSIPLKVNAQFERQRTLLLIDEIDEDTAADSSNVENVIKNKLIKSKSHFAYPAEFLTKCKDRLQTLSKTEKDNMIIDLLHERSSYIEKLKLAKDVIKSSENAITHVPSNLCVPQLNLGESKVHLAFLFSSPLIRKCQARVENIMQLDYLSEINDIVNVCEGIAYEFKIKTDVATVSNLRSTITDCPIALHFSGHGIENTVASLGSAYYLHQDKGNILLLEDEQGMSDYFFEKDLKHLIEMSKSTFEVVFVSSCYSQFAGEVFLNAGAKHVICIRNGERISDKASLRFSKVFYETLFVKNYNV